jgi:DNA-binding response OmpR family regulator
LLDFLKTKNVLIVEDEEDIQQYFKDTLEFFFKKVYCALDGQKALEIYHEKNIDAIFTDYAMPVMDGYELVKSIRKINKDIPITIISNYDDRVRLQKCMTLNLSGYLFKPLDYNDIKSFLEKFSKELLEKTNENIFISKNCTLNTLNYKLVINDTEYKLTQLEIEFFKLMITRPNIVVHYEEIYSALYQFDMNITSLKNLVYRLKTKYKFDKIKNVINVGYILVVDDV